MVLSTANFTTLRNNVFCHAHKRAIVTLSAGRESADVEKIKREYPWRGREEEVVEDLISLSFLLFLSLSLSLSLTLTLSHPTTANSGPLWP